MLQISFKPSYLHKMMVKLEIIHKQLTRNKRKTFFGWLKIQTSPAVKKRRIFDIWSRTKVMALSHIFAPSKRAKITTLGAYISGLEEKFNNCRDGAISNILRSWGISRCSLGPWYVIDVGCRIVGRCHQFCCLLSLHFNHPCRNVCERESGYACICECLREKMWEW